PIHTFLAPHHNALTISALAAAYPVEPGWRTRLSDDTLVCRGEEVTCGQLRAAVDEHRADGVRSLKLVSRAGLGRCQGRICGRNVVRKSTRLNSSHGKNT